jgi:hypothetical protein
LALQTKVRLNLAKFPVLKAHYMLTKSGMYAHDAEVTANTHEKATKANMSEKNCQSHLV